MKIYNRRYTGSKYKLISWIFELLHQHCTDCNSFFDVFGGTGVVTYGALESYNNFIVNDFLYSNEVIYRAFFEQEEFDKDKLNVITNNYNKIGKIDLEDNYVSDNYGDKYFSFNDAKIIGYIRQDIEDKKKAGVLNKKEYTDDGYLYWRL